MTSQEILDKIVELRNELLKLDRDSPSFPTPIQYTFHKILEVAQAMTERQRDLEEWNHQAWMANAGLQARLKDPR